METIDTQIWINVATCIAIVGIICNIFLFIKLRNIRKKLDGK